MRVPSISPDMSQASERRVFRVHTPSTIRTGHDRTDHPEEHRSTTSDSAGSMREHRDAHARHRRRQHRPAVDRIRSRYRSQRPAMGDRRVHAGIGDGGSQRRIVGRPTGSTPCFRHRHSVVHHGISVLRSGAEHLGARPRAGRSGYRRCRTLRLLTCLAGGRVREGSPARDCSGCIRRHDRGRVCRRPTGGRVAHRVVGLARNLFDQRSDRVDHTGDDGAVGSRVTRSSTSPRGRARADSGVHRPGSSGVRFVTRQRGWVVRAAADDRRSDRRGRHDRFLPARASYHRAHAGPRICSPIGPSPERRSQRSRSLPPCSPSSSTRPSTCRTYCICLPWTPAWCIYRRR